MICATNRKKDLDPALLSRVDLNIRFDLPDYTTRIQIFKRYAKQLSQEDLKELASVSGALSGRDISDICKDAERKWASKFIRGEVKSMIPEVSVYKESTRQRKASMEDSNLRMELDTPQ